MPFITVYHIECRKKTDILSNIFQQFLTFCSSLCQDWIKTQSICNLRLLDIFTVVKSICFAVRRKPQNPTSKTRYDMNSSCRKATYRTYTRISSAKHISRIRQNSYRCVALQRTCQDRRTVNIRTY